ncbi:MAG: hypothetical protein R2750_02985 [Bacteroidales bacterium]
MLIPVSSFILFFQLFISKGELNKIIENYIVYSGAVDHKFFILYLTSGVSHIFISFFVISLFWNKLFDSYTDIKRRIIKKNFWIHLIIIVTLFQTVDILNCNLSIMSHDRIYYILSKSTTFEYLFTSIPGFAINGNTINLFYTFSIIPVVLIIFGLVVIILTCMNLGKDLSILFYQLENNISETKKIELQTRIESFHNYLFVLSFVLVTSTIATILFFQLPLICISDGEQYDSYKSTSYGMGICWGVIFTLTMLTMCYYPYVIIQKKLKKIMRDGEVSGNKELGDWLEKIGDNFLIYKNLQSLISVLSPTIIGLLANLF